jgi:hypothetical protein
MQNAIILTNNPKALERQDLPLREVKGGYRDVLVAVRDLVHRGHKLLTHPLAGSVKPHIMPYRSIVLEAIPGPVDFDSLRIIEGSIEVADKFLRNGSNRQWNNTVLADFAVVDYSLLCSALESLT